MGRFLLYLWGTVLLLPMPVAAQVLTAEHHRPYRTDSMSMYKLPYVDVADSGQHCVWDFSNLSTDSAETVNADFYGLSEADTTLIGLHRERANFYYHYMSDTLWMTGYENARAHVQYSTPIPLLRFPLSYGDTLYGPFFGAGQYCHLVPLSTQGTSVTTADAIGRLVLPDMTVDTTLRVHTRMRYRMNDDSTWVQEEHYRWYGALYRYPLWETRRVETIRDTTLTLWASSYYLPQDPERVQEESKTPQRSPEEEMNTEEKAEILVQDVSYLPNPVYADLQISYSLIRSARVYISLHHNGGLSTYQTPVHTEDAGAHSVTVHMSGLPIGTYVVYIHADDMVVSGNIIKL